MNAFNSKHNQKTLTPTNSKITTENMLSYPISFPKWKTESQISEVDIVLFHQWVSDYILFTCLKSIKHSFGTRTHSVIISAMPSLIPCTLSLEANSKKVRLVTKSKTFQWLQNLLLWLIECAPSNMSLKCSYVGTENICNLCEHEISEVMNEFWTLRKGLL